jgi:nucleoside-diphosphate-sugar epimerase
MRKVLLVGGAGYVGCVLAEELVERGYAVKILDRLYFGDHGLREIRDRVELVVSDMRVIDPEILRDVDAVVNLGGLSNDPTAEYNPKANYEMNTTATIELANMCQELGVTCLPPRAPYMTVVSATTWAMLCKMKPVR